MASKQGAIVVLVGSGLVAVGSLLPWATIRSIFGEISIMGTEGDGILTLGLAVVGLLAGTAALVGKSRLAAVGIATGILAGLLAVNAISNVSEAADGAGVSAAVGTGLWLIVVGAIVAIGGGVAALRARPAE